MAAHTPWFRAFDGWWYAQISEGGKRKQVKLVKGKDKKKEAMTAFHRLMAVEQPDDPLFAAQLTVAQVFDLYLEHAKLHTVSYDWYFTFLQDATNCFGAITLRTLRPIHVTKWMDGKEWSDTTRNKVIGCLQTAINYAVKQGVIAVNPLRFMTKPPAARRERIVSDDERKLIVAKARGAAFKLVLRAFLETGCRPGEIAKLTAQDVDVKNGLWIIRRHKTAKRTGRPRIVYLTPTMVELTRELVKQHPTGTLFRNSRGEPFRVNAITSRFTRLKKKFPQLAGIVAYSYRHTYVTEALAQGISDAVVAELVGHSGTAMIHKHYGHITQKRELLRAAAEKAVSGMAS